MTGPSVVSVEVCQSLLDRDYRGTISRLAEGADWAGLRLALCYGLSLPAGKEWGTRSERAEWIANARASHVRKLAAKTVIDLGWPDEVRSKFVHYVGRRRGFGPLLAAVKRGRLG